MSLSNLITKEELYEYTPPLSKNSNQLGGVPASNYVTTNTEQVITEDKTFRRSALFTTINPSGSSIDDKDVAELSCQGLFIEDGYGDDRAEYRKSSVKLTSGETAYMRIGFSATNVTTNPRIEWGSSSSELKRITIPSASGTLATTDDIPSTTSILQKVYPIGSIYISVVSTNPFTLFGFGTWVAFATGRTLVGIDTTTSVFSTVLQEGGEINHTLTTSEMPSHTHTQTQHTHNNTSHATAANHKLLTVDSWSANTIGMRYNGNASGVGAIEVSSGTQEYETYFQRGLKKAVDALSFYSDYATATNNSTGGGGAHNNLQPYITVYMWRRTA